MADDTKAGARTTALVLQGGGALGAYQAGAFEALAQHAPRIDWLAGISIGAINSAIIAGNPPDKRVERLRDFWTTVSGRVAFNPMFGEAFDGMFLGASAMTTVLTGAPGFFTPRVPSPHLHLDGSPGALSYYDTSELRSTLERLVDFDRINHGEVRLSVGAVNVRTGNFTYFDSAERKLGPEHILASGALPPGFPPVEIDGEAYWDGGLVSNTPLQYVMDVSTAHDLLVFQVDLFGARGPMPENLAQVARRAKEITYSSRTRLNTDVARERHALARAFSRVLERLPPEAAHDPDVQLLRAHAKTSGLTLVHLIYRNAPGEGFSKDYEFSRLSVDRHWRAGLDDAGAALARPDWRLPGNGGVRVFDANNPDPARTVAAGENPKAHAKAH
ncbi:patatin-like phospholipase family protein [Phenylobacterium sp.]|uniref:patatin-like phospholipase family protein n=1 Tax=Phenylobacterium sp. TaxID=1871053 RepID=UPI0035B2871C